MNEQKQERVRYFQSLESSVVWRTSSKTTMGERFYNGSWDEVPNDDVPLSKCNWQALTPDEAAAIIGRENVPECSVTDDMKPSGKRYTSVEAMVDDMEGGWQTKAVFYKTLYDKLNQPPVWIPVSKCDLKPGEAFWYLCANGTIGFMPRGFEHPQEFFDNDIDGITHYCRAIGCYQIPKPPEKEQEDDGFEKWFAGNQDCHGDLKQVYHMAWLASRASLAKEGR